MSEGEPLLPVLPYATPRLPDGPPPDLGRRHVLLVATWFAVVVGNIAGAHLFDPLGSGVTGLGGLMCMDLLIAVLVPLLVAALAPRPIAWVACIIFGFATLGVAFALMWFVGQMLASC